jgi:DNA phosphorothioation-dependent restriction protein DptH
MRPRMDTIRIELLAQEILARLKHTAEGHCVRIDYLDRTEAQLVCHHLAGNQQPQQITFHILSTNNHSLQQNPLLITTDRAIEIRNRKKGRLGLFVPSDVVDAAYSSIGNSFAQIDARELHARVLKQVLARLKQLSGETEKAVREVFS